MLEPDDEKAHQRRVAGQRLEILDALVAALDRRVEVFEVIATSADAEAARTRLGALLGVDQIGATAVLDLQARRFTQSEAGRIRQEREYMRELLR